MRSLIQVGLSYLASIVATDSCTFCKQICGVVRVKPHTGTAETLVKRGDVDSQVDPDTCLVLMVIHMKEDTEEQCIHEVVCIAVCATV